GLSSAIAAIPTTDSTADLSGLTSDLAAAQTAIDAITAALADVSSAADLAAVNTAIADLQEDVNTLLEADAVINQPVTINNAATLEYVSTLIASGDDDPNVIVNGDVTINLTAITQAGSVTLANAIASKIRTVIGDVTVTSDAALNLSSLSFIDGDYSVSGSDANDVNLATISGDLTTNYAGANDYSHLSSVDDVVISNSVSATSVVFGDNTTVGSIDDDTAGTGVVVFPNATLISLGTAPVTDVTANKATTVELKATAAAAGLTISATAADAINLNSLASAGGTLSITGTGTTIIHVDALTSAGVITVADSDESHFGALTQATGAISVAADTAANFAALTDIDAASSIGGATVILTELAAATGTLTLPDATTANLPAFSTSATGQLAATLATSVNLVSTALADISAPKATSLTLTALAVDFTTTEATRAAQLPLVSTLAITAKTISDGTAAGVTTTDIDITSTNTLTTVTVAGDVHSLSVDGGDIASLTTSGNISDILIENTGDLTTLSLGHTYITGDAAATVSVQNADKLTALDLSNISKVKTVDVQGNLVLTSIIAPSATVLPEAGAAISVTTGTNSLTGTYTNGVNPVAATETTPAVARINPIIASDSVNSLLTWWNAAAANADTGIVTSTSIDIENINYDNAGTAAKGSLTVAIAANNTASAGSQGAAAAPIADAATRAMVTAE
ncbi:MAG: hypothetical protein L7S43_02830, partial [Flavobacteriaceae bacterium]|nr:hypothetical protein [Flavobacteriaceae bacterium]